MYGYPETTALYSGDLPIAKEHTMWNQVPQGFSLAGVHCRIKRDPQKFDLTLVVCDRPATGVGVYTQNLVYAAPVALDRSRTPSERIRAVVICSGVANACTGRARAWTTPGQMARLAAAACGAAASRPWCSPRA